MKRIIPKIIGSLLFLALCFSQAFADDTKIIKDEPDAEMIKEEQEQQTAKIEDALKNGKLRFVATRILPSGYSSKALQGDSYLLEIGSDTVEAALPYIGNLHSASHFSGEDMSIKFVSTDFTKKVTTSKRGWNLKITINDNRRNGYRLNLSMTKAGVATLTVNDAKRQTVSFSGYLEFL